MKEVIQLGQVKSIRLGQDSQKEAKQGDEVAISISGAVKKQGDETSEATHVTVGRQINEGDVLLVDVPESHVRVLRKRNLTEMEKEILEGLMLAQSEFNIKSTPSFIINGQLLGGNKPIKDFRQIIQKILSQ